MVSTSRQTIRLIGQLSTVGLSFVFAIVLGFAAGYFVDTRFGTAPWLSLVGFFLGVAAGVLNVYRVMQLASVKEMDEKGGSRNSADPSS